MVQQYLHNIDLITIDLRTCCHVQRSHSRVIPDVDIGIVLN